MPDSLWPRLKTAALAGLGLSLVVPLLAHAHTNSAIRFMADNFCYTAARREYGLVCAQHDLEALQRLPVTEVNANPVQSWVVLREIELRP